MKAAITDMYAMINKASDPLISKIEGIVKAISKKHGVSVMILKIILTTN